MHTSSIVGIVQDITESCKEQQEQAEKEAAAAQLNATLAAQLKHKEEMYRLLRTISHEIRNPLHGILGNTQALPDMLQHCEQQQEAAADVTRRASADVSDDVSQSSSDVASSGGASPTQLSPTSSAESAWGAAAAQPQLQLPQLQPRRRASSSATCLSAGYSSSSSTGSSSDGAPHRQQ
jgi:signal transduction histidine kinase